MPNPAVNLTFGRETRSITPGAVKGQNLIDLASLAPHEQLLLDRPGDVDIPVAPDDIIFIEGGEAFSIGDGSPHVEDNPATRRAVDFVINDKPPEPSRQRVAKFTGAELKAIVNDEAADLWIDLDGLADELIEDDHRIIVQPRNKFFTVARDSEDRFYEFKVLLDGDTRPFRFPAGTTVLAAIRRSLPPRDRSDAGKFDMVDIDVGTHPLGHGSTLKEAGVRDGHTLSITKQHGGGGGE